MTGIAGCTSDSDPQSSVQIENNAISMSLPERVRQVARLGTVPLRVRVTINETAMQEEPVPNTVTGNVQVIANIPADRTNEIKIEWLALPQGTPVLLAERTTITQPNQQNLLISSYIDTGERFDFDGDGIFNLQEARENRNLLDRYDLEVPLQTTFLGPQRELIPGGADSDVSGSASTADENTSFSLRHDGSNMYLYVCGQDEEVQSDGFDGNPDGFWHDDAVFLYLDGGDSDNSTYDGFDDFQIAFIRATGEKIVSKGANNQFCPQGDCVTHSFNDPSLNSQCIYELNVTMPLADLNIAPGIDVGFDLEITDDDDGGLREGSSGFIGFDDNSDLDPSTFGKVILR